MGELQKRIVRLEMFDLSSNPKECDLVDSKQIAKIVEEMCQEFPIKQSPVFTDKNIVETLIWFDKWIR